MLTPDVGHDLDRAVAEAMGWKQCGTNEHKGEAWPVGIPPRGWKHPQVASIVSDGEEQWTIYKFSTDPATLAEMLEWLCRECEVAISSYANGQWCATDHKRRHLAEGATINEAVARLVLMVASMGATKEP